jgi:hypothetical protein
VWDTQPKTAKVNTIITGAAGDPSGPSVKVKAVDADGNLLSSAGGTVTLNQSAGTFTPAVPSAARGRAQPADDDPRDEGRQVGRGGVLSGAAVTFASGASRLAPCTVWIVARTPAVSSVRSD